MWSFGYSSIFNWFQRFSKGYRMYMDIRARHKNRISPPLSHRHLATWVESPFFLLVGPIKYPLDFLVSLHLALYGELILFSGFFHNVPVLTVLYYILYRTIMYYIVLYCKLLYARNLSITSKETQQWCLYVIWYV